MIIRKPIHIYLLALLLLFAGTLTAQPQLDQMIQQRGQFEKDINHIDNLLKNVSTKRKSGLQELTLIRKKISTRRQVLTTIDRQINFLTDELERRQEAITILQAELTEIRRSYSELLVHYYSMRNKDNWVMYIIASETVTQAYKRMRYFRDILALLQAQADKIIEKTNRLSDEITDMARKQQLLQESIGDKRKEVDLLETEQKQSQTVLTELKGQEQELRKQLDEKRQDFARLNNTLKELFREDAIKNLDISSTEVRLISDKFEGNKGFLPWPAIGTITSNFGQHMHAVYKNLELPPNNGIDIQTPNNADVFAIFGGKVTQIIKIPLTGEKGIVVRHGAYLTVYYRLGDVNIKVGDEVKARQKIATVATSSEGSVLHFEIQKIAQNGEAPKPLNPEQWIIR